MFRADLIPVLLPQPLQGDRVRGLAVDVEQHAVLFPDGNQVMFRLPFRVSGPGEPDLAPGNQQFPEPPGILHMDCFRLSIQLHPGDEPVQPFQEHRPAGIVIFHLITLPDVSDGTVIIGTTLYILLTYQAI